MNPTPIPSKPAYQWATEATVRPRSSHAEWLRPTREPVEAGRFLVHFLIAFCFGVLATLAWQSYSDAPRGMIANLSPWLSWLAPSPASALGRTLPPLHHPAKRSSKRYRLVSPKSGNASRRSPRNSPPSRSR
jgi:hypothetical protein